MSFSEFLVMDPSNAEEESVRIPMERRGLGTKGEYIGLQTNHYMVDMKSTEGAYFFHYNVSVCYEDGHPVHNRDISRRVLDTVHRTYKTEFGTLFAYDGKKSLFTVARFHRNKLEFTGVLVDVTSKRHESPNDTNQKRLHRPDDTKIFKVVINFAAKIPMQAIGNALRGQEVENSQDVIRALDIIVKQRATKMGCQLFGQSYFHNSPRNLFDVGGGLRGCQGFHSSIQTTQSGLSLNLDVSTTVIIQPGPVVDFLIANQNVKDPHSIDWVKAKHTLKNLRINTSHTNQEFKITGLSGRPCKEQTFSLKQKSKEDDEVQTIEITVYEYFMKYQNMQLCYSADLPCINVGKSKKPTYFPLELCSLVSLQRYKKALSISQRASLLMKSRQTPEERESTLSEALIINDYEAEPLLVARGITIGRHFTFIHGRVLPAPRLKVGNEEDFFPSNGRWNLNDKKLVEPANIERWAIVNFSSSCEICSLVQDLIKCGKMNGIAIEQPFNVFEENQQFRQATPFVRVEKMFEEIHSNFPGVPKFLLCLLPERKNCDIYGPWKKKILVEYGIVTQCMAPTGVNDQYLTNLLLKVNAKLGGLNSMLAVEHSSSIPLVSKVPTIILGMDVSHGSPGQSNIPSIAAVVSSRQWPLISRYRASVRTQSPKVEMIESLFKRVSETEDEGILRELLLDFYVSSGKRKPEQIIIFRDGVSESQFSQVLNIELDQIIEACKFLDEKWNPKFVVIVAQKNHHTRFFQSKSPDNVPPGTVIDNEICHPRNYDFYLCAHAGMTGTTRPTHYHVLLDEVGFSADELQELVHSLSYVYQRSSTAISIVAPIRYAHLAAKQFGKWMKFEDTLETSSSSSHGDGGVVSHVGAVPVPQLPRLHENVCNSMFFC